MGSKIYMKYCFYTRQVAISIFRRFFLRKVWLLNVVPYVSESRKLSVPSRTFGLEACDIIMTLWEPQKLVLMPWIQIKVMKTLVIDMFSWQYFQSKLITFWRHTIANEGLGRHQALKTHFCSLRPRPGDENVLKL